MGLSAKKVRSSAFHPSLLSFITTFQCPLTCAHCSIESSPKRKVRLSLDDMYSVIDQATEIQSVRNIVFTGGEPTLLGNDLFAAIRYAKMAGFRTRIVTSGFWAKTEIAADKMLYALLSAGLDEFNISFDQFHRPWVDDSTISTAARSAVTMGLPTVISVQVTKSTVTTADALREKLGLCDVEQSKLYFYLGAAAPVGRGRYTLDKDDLICVDDLLERPVDHCNGCQAALRTLSIFPTKDVLACCTEFDQKLSIGNISIDTLVTMINRAADDVFLNDIAIRGPFQILSDLNGKTVQENQSSYVNQCHACSELRRNPIYRDGLITLLEERKANIAVERGIRSAIERIIETNKPKHAVA